MLSSRRGMLLGMVGLVAAPAVVKADVLMPIFLSPDERWRRQVFGPVVSKIKDSLFDNGEVDRLLYQPQITEFLNGLHRRGVVEKWSGKGLRISSNHSRLELDVKPGFRQHFVRLNIDITSDSVPLAA